MAADPISGHRLHPHTADVIVEAGGPDDLACAQEAARALIEICVSGEPDPEAGLRVSRVSATGSAPKAIVMLAQESVGADGRSRCRFIVDV